MLYQMHGGEEGLELGERQEKGFALMVTPRGLRRVTPLNALKVKNKNKPPNPQTKPNKKPTKQNPTQSSTNRGSVSDPRELSLESTGLKSPPAAAGPARRDSPSCRRPSSALPSLPLPLFPHLPSTLHCGPAQ